MSVHNAGSLYVVRLKTVGWPAKVKFWIDMMRWSSAFMKTGDIAVNEDTVGGTAASIYNT